MAAAAILIFCAKLNKTVVDRGKFMKFNRNINSYKAKMTKWHK